MNLWSALLIAETLVGGQLLVCTEYAPIYGVFAYLVVSIGHHLLLVRGGRFKEIEAEFKGRDLPHLRASFYAYVIGSILLFFVVLASTVVGNS